MRIPAILLAGATISLAWLAGAQAQTGATPASVPQETAAASPVAAPAPAMAVAPESAAAAERVAAADAPAAASSAESAAADDPVVCRTYIETGTIGRRQKVCMTKSEWENHRQASKKFLKAVNQSRSTQPGGESLGP